MQGMSNVSAGCLICTSLSICYNVRENAKLTLLGAAGKPVNVMNAKRLNCFYGSLIDRLGTLFGLVVHVNSI